MGGAGARDGVDGPRDAAHLRGVDRSRVLTGGPRPEAPSPHEREQVIALLQQATSDGGVHLIETLVAGQAVLSEAELRSRYEGWEIKMVPEPGASQTFMAKKLVA